MVGHSIMLGGVRAPSAPPPGSPLSVWDVLGITWEIQPVSPVFPSIQAAAYFEVIFYLGKNDSCCSCIIL